MPHRPNLHNPLNQPQTRMILPNSDQRPMLPNQLLNHIHNPNMSDMQNMSGSLQPQHRLPMPQGPRPTSMPSTMIPQPNTVPQQKPMPSQPNPPSPSESPDPMLRAKVLLPQLKESLVILMSVASQNFEVNNHVDDIKKVTDVGRRKYEKCLEHFYSLCDQLELLLNLAYQQLNGMVQCVKYTPHLATINIKDGNAPNLYENYTITIDQQIIFAKDMHRVLQNCCNKLFEHRSNVPLS